ncbi:hypothetical protein MAJHIDBO_00985 [Propionibacterium freudenreichii subsp. shermanii]|nr:hypothetical protein MAJHIDBO_00985 [Propionibacterium freudenreichii subsp. shermanii]SPS08782.1 hypothetical protein MAJHIDBO_00985 [Propionibacterium freudenreichii subsp. shermanii]
MVLPTCGISSRRSSDSSRPAAIVCQLANRVRGIDTAWAISLMSEATFAASCALPCTAPAFSATPCDSARHSNTMPGAASCQSGVWSMSSTVK